MDAIVTSGIRGGQRNSRTATAQHAEGRSTRRLHVTSPWNHRRLWLFIWPKHAQGPKRIYQIWSL